MKVQATFASLLVGSLVGSMVGLSSALASTPEDNDSRPFEAYTVNKETKVQIVKFTEGSSEKTVAGATVRLSSGSDITILGAGLDPAFGDLVHIGVDDDTEGTPGDFWIRSTDLVDAALEASDFASDGEDPTTLEEDTTVYNLNDVAEAKRHAKRKKKMTYCYRFVKQYLLKTGKVHRYLPGGSAWMAMNYLPQDGFKKTGHGPHTAKLGEVCVYKGGTGGNGHIEIRRPQGWWYGYGYAGPLSDRLPRTLIGCYTK